MHYIEKKTISTNKKVRQSTIENVIQRIIVVPNIKNMQFAAVEKSGTKNCVTDERTNRDANQYMPSFGARI